MGRVVEFGGNEWLLGATLTLALLVAMALLLWYGMGILHQLAHVNYHRPPRQPRRTSVTLPGGFQHETDWGESLQNEKIRQSLTEDLVQDEQLKALRANLSEVVEGNKVRDKRLDEMARGLYLLQEYLRGLAEQTEEEIGEEEQP